VTSTDAVIYLLRYMYKQSRKNVTVVFIKN